MHLVQRLPFGALQLLALLLVLAFSFPAYAVTDQTPTNIALTGVADTTVAADITGNTFTNTGYEIAEIINGSGASINVTLDAFPAGGQGAPDGLVVSDPVVAVPAGTRKKIGPFRKGTFNDAANKVKLTCSAVTTVTVAVYLFNPQP